ALFANRKAISSFSSFLLLPFFFPLPLLSFLPSSFPFLSPPLSFFFPLSFLSLLLSPFPPFPLPLFPPLFFFPFFSP
ncbi:hypothetical protein ACXWR7_13900, partial [Streptococcus pyogenes]